ncbi:FtsX-like permease family protein [Brevibacterium sp. UCMA 11754]|uniref:FtsX-like permease family protein n=1 Tax=Brevibacterium sp. UCMA 11754 TaxID=2749198 RepID=UPI001F279523|nr:ABC transporter permease [Brevibacterium sp. UCMA 11754]MCF2573761.1 FtsX-like permease family protein [Brevibacterium sp. UCMA 11754]
MNPFREIRANPRQFAPSFLVVFIAGLFGTAIMQGIGILSAWMTSTEEIDESATARILIALVGLTFFVIALFVSSIVIANTFSIIIAGRSRQLALLRLIGASSKRLRRSAALEGLIIAVPGVIAALLVSTALAGLTLTILGDQIRYDADLLHAEVFVPAAATLLVTWYAAYLGARRISDISPVEATSQTVERSPEELRPSKRSLTTVIALLGVGLVMLIGGAAVGVAINNPLGLPVATVGGAISFLGFIIGNPWILPPLQTLVGQLLARTSSSRLAAKTIARHPARSARTVIGLVIGVTLIVMFATAMTTFRTQLEVYAALLGQRGREADGDAVTTVVDQTMMFFLGMVVFSVVIAVIGVANALMLSVRQRTQEIGLLMALGQTPRRVRTMVLSESLQLSVTGCAVALPLGIFYGWIGALAVISPLTGFFAPSLPWWVLIVVVVGSILAVAVASGRPARAATSVNPVEALEAV